MGTWTALVAIALATPLLYAEDAVPYRLGAGDSIGIQVMNHPEYSLQLTIRPDGRASYPTTGELNLAGLTVEELCELIKDSLADRLREPEVFVNVVGFRPTKVFVLGAVANPGQVDVPQEGMLVRDVLARVGGARADAELAQAVLYQTGAEPITLSLVEEMDAKPGAGTTMNPGDFLFVPQRIVKQVTIAGQVRSSGRVIIEPRDTILDLILKAGGFAERADLEDSRIIRTDGTIEEVDLRNVYSGEETDIGLAPNDTLIVGRAEQIAPVLVLGQVGAGGRFPYDPLATLGDLLAMAGGPTGEADAKHSRILHLDGTVTPIDLEAVLEGQADEKLRDIQLQPGDILMVPKQLDRVALLGQISRPGFYGIEEGTRLSQVLIEAGGVLVREGKGKIGYLVRRTDMSSGEPLQEEVEVRRLNISGVLFRGKTKDDVELQAGDLIYVPGDKELGFWDQYRRNPLGLLSLISLIERVF